MAPKDFYHPFEPYEIQQQFMEAVYQCIEQGKVGIFESPTGTGKSLSLICGSLTWLREHKRKTYDEAVATVELDDDEPEWMREHAVESRGREIKQMRADFEARLAKVREREKEIKERSAIANDEPPTKRQKKSHNAAEKGEEQEEDQFVLNDYNSDDELSTAKKHEYSPEVAKLMEKMGLLPKSDQERAKDEEIDELKIYFCSRTHSQLSQFTGELKRVRLPPSLPLEHNDQNPVEYIKQLTLGSRSNLCINPKVNKLSTSTAINEKCIELQQSSTPTAKKCSFLPNKDSEDVVLDFRDHALAKLRDIEDLAKLGTKLQICPYYASRPAIGNAEIVTLPYPLLLQKAAREALGYSLKNHIVIIDEAHNLINAVEGTYASQISEKQLQKAKSGLMIYLQKFRNRLKGSNRSYATQVVRVMDSLLGFINSVKAQNSTGDTVTPSALLAGKSVDQINLTKLVRYINESKLARKVEGYAAYSAQPDPTSKTKEQWTSAEPADVPTLTHVQNFLAALMNPSREGRFLWSKEDGNIIIRYLLLDPSTHFREIVEDARAVILAGGTMSPMDDYKQQLFPYLESITTFSCGHLIPSSSLFVRAITSDAGGRIDFTFKSRSDATASRLGRALINIAGKVKGGMVVFFPSYGYLETLVKSWKANPTLPQLEAVKPVFCDSRSGSTDRTFKLYSEAVVNDKQRGAILLSVLGGKLSEGINFADDLGRCVVVVGLPFPNIESPDLKMKMQYLDIKAVERGEPKEKAGRDYVENLCMRSVNQAIGRVIRHKDDWASIILFDARYEDARIQGKLPRWIGSCVDAKASGGARNVVVGLEKFFQRKIQ